MKLYNLRKVQVMAGHGYISSTESYKADHLDDLKKTSKITIRSDELKLEATNGDVQF